MHEAQREAKQYISDMIAILRGLYVYVDADVTPLQAEDVADSLDCLKGVVKNIAMSIEERTPREDIICDEGAECILQLQRVLRAFSDFKNQLDTVQDLLHDNKWSPEEYATIQRLLKLTEDKLNFTRDTSTKVLLNYIEPRLVKRWCVTGTI